MSAALYLCLHLRDFAAQAMACAHPELRHRPLAILGGTPPLEYVFGVNRRARQAGVEIGMGRMQAELFVGTAILPRERAQEERAFANVMDCAGRFSPRIQAIDHPSKPTTGLLGTPIDHPSKPTTGLLGTPIAAPQEHSSEATLILDIRNSTRLLGTAEQIAGAILRDLGAAGYKASVSISRNAYAAVLAARGNAARGNACATIIPSGREAQTLSPLPLTVLELDPEQAQTLAAWGIRTLGQLAALPARPLAARLGQSGLRLQAQARGDYNHLLVPAEEPADAPLHAGVELEHPVELLEPLLFLLNQLLEQVLERAAQRAQAIASLELCLGLDAAGGPHPPSIPHLPKDGRYGAPSSPPLPEEDHRTIRPALPERDRLVLLKLIQLELELHPPASAIVALHIAAHPARPQTAQQGLFASQAPEPGRMEVLLARLRKLVGEGRAGSPELLGSHAPEAFRMARFAPDDSLGSPLLSLKPALQVPHICPLLADVGEQSAAVTLSPALRLLRPPREVAMELCRGAPAAMRCEGRRHKVQASSGPWRTSGAWWTHPAWCREEWEVLLQNDVLQDKGAPHLPSLADVGEAEGGPHPTHVRANVGSAAPHQVTSPRCLRLAHDPANGAWYVIGSYD